MEPRAANLLTLNAGSSSLKTAIYRAGPLPRRLLAASASGIGQQSGKLKITRDDGTPLLDQSVALADHRAALDQTLAWLHSNSHLEQVKAVGHRIVHGGLEYTEPTRIDSRVIADLERLVPLAPDHLPQSLAAIEAVSAALAGVPQVGCFDTEFHRTLPPRARTLPLTEELTRRGVVRFGFHGLSYEYLTEQLRELDPEACGGRAVLAHLGNGASMAAVLRGTSIDTSMGFTPAGGLMMSSRSGDLDPGVLVYLLRSAGYNARQLNELVNQQSGLAGISAGSSSMRELLAERDGNPRAALAVEMFCYTARKVLAGYAAALEGLDTLVFSGGIGENSNEIRREICTGLDFLGIRLDEAANRAGAELISARDSRVAVRVIQTDEDFMIARHTSRLLAQEEKSA